jgi:hypothetical protein
MKKIISAVALVSLLAGCSSFKVVVNDDPFKQSTVVTTDMWHKVIDSRMDNRRVLYTKEIKNGRVLDPTVSFEFFCIISSFYGYNGEDLKTDAVILCDNKNFNVKLFNVKNNKQNNIYVNNYSAGTYQSSTLLADMKLTADVQKAILNCELYQIRFYAGNSPITLRATGSQLDAVKKFLAADATNIKKK